MNKCIILQKRDHKDLENEINEVIQQFDEEVLIDIKYAAMADENNNYYSALILYYTNEDT